MRQEKPARPCIWAKQESTTVMIQELNQEQLQNIIEELLDWDALELQIRENRDEQSAEVLFPYLMNDATEYFVRLQGCRIQGNWCGDKKGILSVAFETEDIDETEGVVLITQDNGIVLRIAYNRALEEMHCYQYHRIGHDWRREKDHLRIRRLVNLLCVLHDKCSYLGDAASTETERKIALLMEFQPLCYWTPINDSIEEWYPESLEGIYAMEDLAEEAGDTAYLELLQQYRLFWENFDESLTGKRMQKQLFKLREKQNLLQRALVLPEHEGVLNLLEQKIEEESLHWEPRIYSPELTAYMEELRREKVEEYKKKGYEGEYPLLHIPGERVVFVEEHPFMELEWADYSFHIYEIREKT